MTLFSTLTRPTAQALVLAEVIVSKSMAVNDRFSMIVILYSKRRALQGLLASFLFMIIFVFYDSNEPDLCYLCIGKLTYMIRILHTIILYIATTVIIACILNLLICNITYYLISRSTTAMLIAQVIGWAAAIVLEVLFVRCRPLTKAELQEKPWYRVRFSRS